ncbi:MAG: TnpV protein [Dysosmobacter sp.]|nr:TnpV protein [Dysosmobacter sp.]
MKIELDYVKVGDYYLPDLTIEPQPNRSLGKYGLLRRQYLKEHRPGLYNRLALNGTLYAHLLETEDAANDMLDSMMPGMAKEAGATENLKARDPMRWVGLMNCCKAQVEEIIFTELIYN